MVLAKLLEPFSKRTIFAKETRGEQAMRDFDLETAYFQISSAILAHKDLPTILDLVVRESLNSLRAHRVTIFFMDEASGILRAQFIDVLKPLYRQVGLPEEKEVAKKAIKQAKSFFLQEPQDFSEFSEYRDRGVKISSLLSIPLSSQGKSVGVLSVVLINEKRRFSAGDLKYLFFFGNLASLAMENAHLIEKLHREISTRKTFEQYLDDMVHRVQGLVRKEGWQKEEPLKNILPAPIDAEFRPFDTQTGKMIPGVGMNLTP